METEVLLVKKYKSFLRIFSFSRVSGVVLLTNSLRNEMGNDGKMEERDRETNLVSSFLSEIIFIAIWRHFNFICVVLSSIVIHLACIVRYFDKGQWQWKCLHHYRCPRIQTLNFISFVKLNTRESSLLGRYIVVVVIAIDGVCGRACVRPYLATIIFIKIYFKQ